MKDATQFHIRPARPEEAGLFYTPHPEEDKRLGMPTRPMSKPSGSTGLPEAGAFPQIPCPALAGADRL